MNYTEGGEVVINVSESSLVSELNKYQDPIRLELKSNVHKKKVLTLEQEVSRYIVFSKGG